MPVCLPNTWISNDDDGVNKSWRKGTMRPFFQILNENVTFHRVPLDASLFFFFLPILLFSSVYKKIFVKKSNGRVHSHRTLDWTVHSKRIGPRCFIPTWRTDIGTNIPNVLHRTNVSCPMADLQANVNYLSSKTMVDSEGTDWFRFDCAFVSTRARARDADECRKVKKIGLVAIH